MKRFSIFLNIILFGFLLSCDSQQSATGSNSTSANAISKPVKNENSIVYLFFTIEKSANGTELVTHTDTKITAGFLKNASIENRQNMPGNIAVTFIGKDGEIIAERIIEDPLNPMMETYSEEGINKEKMNFPKAEFSVRFNQTGKISKVILEKINTQSKNNLITINLL